MKFILALVALGITSVAAQAPAKCAKEADAVPACGVRILPSLPISPQFFHYIHPFIPFLSLQLTHLFKQKCIEDGAATVGCKAKDFDCYCKNAEKYTTAAGKCLLAATCRKDALASKTASDAVCACVKAGGGATAGRMFKPPMRF